MGDWYDEPSAFAGGFVPPQQVNGVKTKLATGREIADCNHPECSRQQQVWSLVASRPWRFRYLLFSTKTITERSAATIAPGQLTQSGTS